MPAAMNIWSDTEALRRGVSWLQWAAILLVFFGGVLQVARLFVDRRIARLDFLQAVLSDADASLTMEFPGVLGARSSVHRNDEDKLRVSSESETLLVLSSTQVRATQEAGDRISVTANFTLQPSDRKPGQTVEALLASRRVQVTSAFLRPILATLRNSGVAELKGRLAVRVNALRENSYSFDAAALEQAGAELSIPLLGLDLKAK